MKPLFRIVLVALLGLVMVPIHASAQNEDEENLDRYFEDGGMSERKNILATNLLSPLWGELGLRYERAISKHVSIEIGLKKLTSIYVFEFGSEVDFQFSSFDPVSGWGISIAPHFFFWDKAPEFHYIGPRFAQRTHTLESESKLHVSDISFDYGYNLFLTKRMMFCYEVGFGYRRVNYEEGTKLINYYYGPNKDTYGGLLIYTSLGLGLIF